MQLNINLFSRLFEFSTVNPACE